MHAILTLTTDAGTLAMPLASYLVDALTDLLLAGDQPETPLSPLETLLAENAPLALWAVCRANQLDIQPSSVPRLAEWLQPRLASLLATEPTGGEPARLTAPTRKRLARLAGRSHAIAQLAAQIARGHGQDEDQAYLAGLLHAARQWVTGGDAAALPLPCWLSEALAAIRLARTGAVQSPADCVAAALRITAARTKKSAVSNGIPHFDRRAHQAAAKAVERRWLEDACMARWLPALAACQAKLAELRTHFQRELETEKLESLKELAYGAGHEINNPLANISARAQTLLVDEPDPERRRTLAAINSQAFRAHEMIADMI